MEIKSEWLSRSLLTDEIHFSQNDEVNTQNCQIWSTDNPQEIVIQDIHDKKGTVC